MTQLGPKIGVSVIEPMAKGWNDYQRALDSTGKILSDKSVEVISIENFREILLKPVALRKTLEALKTCRKQLGGYVIGTTDEVEFLDRALAGIKECVELFMVQLSMQADLPQTVLFGTSPSGLTSGSYETEILDKLTSIYFSTDIEPFLSRAIDILLFTMGVSSEYELIYQSPRETTEITEAEILREKSTAAKALAESLSQLVTQRLLSAETAQRLTAIMLNDAVEGANILPEEASKIGKVDPSDAQAGQNRADIEPEEDSKPS
jgi:hypothetical protein